ncbi:hypothetical protein AGMMS49574_06050 [Bacteroidia bacterium]|nr:hypothetical protein AGMMS49574_06050 [Bacteroidia bacterium]
MITSIAARYGRNHYRQRIAATGMAERLGNVLSEGRQRLYAFAICACDIENILRKFRIEKTKIEY